MGLAAHSAAVLGVSNSPICKALGANDRVRVGMIGVGDRGNDSAGQIRSGPRM